MSGFTNETDHAPEGSENVPKNDTLSHDPVEIHEREDGAAARPEESESNTASAVYVPTTSGFTYREPAAASAPEIPKKRSAEKKRFGAVAFAAVLLSLCLVLGLLGGAGGMMLALLHYEANEVPLEPEDIVTDAADEIPTEASATTLHKQPSTVKVVELPEDDGTPLTVSQVYAKVADSVVAISTSSKMSSSFYGGFYVTTGAGSGLIISSDGYIITNYHVIDGASGVEVTLNNGRAYDAIYLDGDVAKDVALLKIDPDEPLVPAEIGSSTALVIGQEVVAVGNPLGTLPGTLTDGIVSALDRTVEIEGYSRTLIQTNAAINPGNSGGGLFDRYGRLVGVVNAKESSEGVEGLGFAIPIDAVFEDVVEIIEDGYIHGRASLDLDLQAITSSSEAYYLYYNQRPGIYVQASSYPEEIDLQKGDRIAAINGIAIDSESDLHSVLSTLKPGDEVTLTVGRVTVYSSGFWTKYKEEGVEVKVTLIEYVPSASITFR